ncbi:MULTISPECIES: GNAT family N-acetyltransferase [unclassified Mumia]|uniref:GNAT family N-acetyltransferase n=1 Tax=unclassified Mumia TaxID=2621872 RepID=UPI0027E284B3|nr:MULTISPECIES: GNAT family N-acetyltransferase [unclassified Mumia]MDD9349782.1 GNAT family N-acetyltransferase [Mumia sp.]
MPPILSALDIRVVGYDHPDAVLLVSEVQAEYARRYGTPDQGPADADEFRGPGGVFAVAYADGTPVATGGWRRLGDDRAEIKRMYVREWARGRGYARAMLAWLEETAAAAGARAIILETGRPQPEAIALYRSSGYTDVEPFGYYADDPLSLYLGKTLA